MIFFDFVLFRDEENKHGANLNIISNSETYLDVKLNLLAARQQFHMGEYCYEFSVKLPNDLPTSFEHPYGNIRYYINATIDKPWSLEKHLIQPFTVINKLDLNLFPQLGLTYAINDEKIMRNWLFKSQNSVSTTLIIEKCE